MCYSKRYRESVADVGLRPRKIKCNVEKIQHFTHLPWDWGRCLTTRPDSLCSLLLILCVLLLYSSISLASCKLHWPSSLFSETGVFSFINLTNMKSSILSWRLWNWKLKRNLMVFFSILGIPMILIFRLLKNLIRILWPANVVLLHF